jgi:hypothetical protein
MSTSDPMAAAVDWLDAYRAAELSIVDFYADNAILECACAGPKALAGSAAIIEYWRQRFAEKPAVELVDLQLAGDLIVVNYRVLDGVVQALLKYNGAGKIEHSRCGPISHHDARAPSLRASGCCRLSSRPS